MAIQDSEILEWAHDDHPGDDFQWWGLDQADEDGNVSSPIVERVEGGAWVLARVWVETDEVRTT
jgi:hypothetical protein